MSPEWHSDESLDSGCHRTRPEWWTTLICSVQQDRYHRSQVHPCRRRPPSPIQDTPKWKDVRLIPTSPRPFPAHVPLFFFQNCIISESGADPLSKMSTPKTPNQSLNRLLLSHFSTLLHLIKSLPSTPSSVARSEEEEDAEDAGGLLLMAVGESTKLLPWVMGARKHVRAYLKVGSFLPFSALASSCSVWPRRT